MGKDGEMVKILALSIAYRKCGKHKIWNCRRLFEIEIDDVLLFCDVIFFPEFDLKPSLYSRKSFYLLLPFTFFIQSDRLK